MMRVQVRGRINATADAVFKDISDFGNLARLAVIASCTVEGRGVGAVRTVTFTNPKLGVVVERLEFYNPSTRTLSYRIINADCLLPVENYLATVRVLEDGPHACILEWGSVFTPRGAPEQEVRPLFEGFYQEAIDVARHAVGG